MSKMMSAKQVEANRRNAQRSTGPKTARGRGVSRLNAVKNRWLAEHVLVRARQAPESSRKFREVQNSFREDLQPVGPVEEMLVDQIVAAHWRWRRVMKAESGEIALSVDEGCWNRTHEHPQRILKQWEAQGDPAYTMNNSSLGLSMMEQQLSRVRAAVMQAGELTRAAILQAVTFLGKPYSLTMELDVFRSECEAKPEGLEEAVWQAKKKELALAFIDQKLKSIQAGKLECILHEDAAEEARQAAEVLPAMETLDKIMRYGTMLERQMYRALVHLERVQRMRLGEAVPPPLAVDLGKSE